MPWPGILQAKRCSSIGAAAIVVCVAAAQQPSGSGDAVDQLVSQEMVARKIPGASIAVINSGRIIKKASYGRASVELDVPVTNSTLFHLASTTKEFTGVAIMALVEDGRISLDESIRTYLPELPAAWAPVTIRHCLSHTSGLPDGVAADQVNIIPLAGDRESLLKTLASMPVAAPGIKAVYNQTELMLLGDVIRTRQPQVLFVLHRGPAAQTDRDIRHEMGRFVGCDSRPRIALHRPGTHGGPLQTAPGRKGKASL
jgi:CubicO group peptidase (beta-lactamase class C family)